MPVRLAEVARHAGVSEATASRVLSGRGYVSPNSQARVRAAVLALDYVPHPAARALSRARTTTAALLVHHAQYPAGGEGTFTSRVVHAVTRGLREMAYDLLYVVVDDEAVTRLERLSAVGRGRSDGVIVLGPAFPVESMRALAATGRPVVLVDNHVPDLGLPSVMADNTPATEALVSHLVVTHGYHRIACLAGPQDWPSTVERVAGYEAVLSAHGLPRHIVHAPETTLRDGALGAEQLIDERPDAIVAVNDALAIGALHHLRRLPHRPAVVGFDDIAWARLTEPPLTTVSVDADLIGLHAARLLLERIERPDDPPAPPVRVAAVPRIRGSCGCEVPQEELA